MKKVCRCFVSAIKSFEDFVCYWGLFLTTFLVFFQVINRYWLHFEIMWLGDLALYVFVFFMLMAIAVTTREKGHTAVEVFGDIVFRGKGKSFAIYKILINLVSLSIVSFFMFPVYTMFRRALTHPEYGTLVPWFNTSWLRETVLVMLLFSAIHLVNIIVSQVSDVKR